MLHTLDPSCRVERSAPEKSDPGHGANEIPLAWGGERGREANRSSGSARVSGADAENLR